MPPLASERPAATAPSDAQLLAAVAARSEPAFGELHRRYRKAIRRVCRHVVGRQDADDCFQEVFARVWQKARLFDPERGSAAGWLLTLARNVARNARARRVDAPTADEPAGAVEAPGVDGLWVAAALERLPPHERHVLELAYHADLSQPEIAAALGVPLGTVKSWTRRGLNHLAERLAAEDAR